MRFNAAMGLVGLAAFSLLYSTQTLLPQLSDDFAVSPTLASLSVSVTTGSLALLVVPVTTIGRRTSRVRLMRSGLLVAVALTLASSWAPTYPSLLVLRALTGAALAAVIAVAMSHVAAEVPPYALATAMGLYVAGNALGGVGGRLVTAAVVDVAGWRWAVAVLAVLAGLVTLAFWVLLPAATSGTGRRVGSRDVRDAPVLVGMRRLLGDPAVLAVLVLTFVLMGGFVATYNYLTYRLTTDPFGLPTAVVGLVFLAYLAGTLTSAGAGWAADRVGRPVVLLSSIVVMGAGLALTLPDRVLAVVSGLLVLTAGFFGAHSVASGWAPVVGRAAPAQASALYVLAYYAGSSVFGTLTGLAWHTGGWPAAAAAVGALVATGAAAATALVSLMRGRARRQSSARGTPAVSSGDGTGNGG